MVCMVIRWCILLYEPSDLVHTIYFTKQQYDWRASKPWSAARVASLMIAKDLNQVFFGFELDWMGS